MRTPSCFAKSLSTVLTVFGLLASFPAVAEEAPPAKAPPTPQAEAQAAPKAASAEPGEAVAAPSSQGASAEAAATSAAKPEPPKPVDEAQPAADPPSVTEVGVQRLPGSAYPEPQIRGLPYGSLALTFHGLQWPYMPSARSGSRFVVGLSGWGWIDTSYLKFGPWFESTKKIAQVEQSNIKYWKQKARFFLRVTPTYSFGGGYFVQGQAEIVATGDQTIGRDEAGGASADTDDLWLRLGKWNSWDVMVGRYEGWEVFHLGMGLDQNTFERQGAVGDGESNFGIAYYGLSDNQFRPDGSAGNFALHLYPLPILRFEVLGMMGSLGKSPAYSTRPVGILDLGWVKLKFGVEYQKLMAQGANNKTDLTKKGIGGAIQFVLAPHLEFGLNAAQGTVWSIDSEGRFDPKGSFTRTSVGGFANLSNGSLKHPLLFGAGAMMSWKEDQNNALGDGQVDRYWLMQSFIAMQYVAFQQLYIKLVGGYSRGHWEIAGNKPIIVFNDEMYSIRLRFAFYY
jgi:hypothetical protein